MVAGYQVAPATLFLLAFFVAPLALFVLYSFYSVKGFDVVPDFTTGSYQTALGDSLYQHVLLKTVLIALLTATLVLVSAYAFTYIAVFVFPRYRDILLFVVLVSLFSGYLVRVYAWRTILGSQGIVNTALMNLGVIHTPLHFLAYSWQGIVITMANLLFPLAVLPLYAAMINVPPSLLEASRDLGASTIWTVRRVLLPLTLSGVRTAFAFVFVLTAGDYVTPSLIGGTHATMIGTVIADQFGRSFNWPLGAALAVVGSATIAAVFLLFSRMVRVVAR
jgi:spermidine/putrescine transport system permease protein